MAELKLELPPDVTPQEAQLLLAAKLFETKRLTLGQAAKLAGFGKRAFMEILGKLGIPIFNYSGEDFSNEPRS